MSNKTNGFANDHFRAEQLTDKVILVVLTGYPISAEMWNIMRDDICTNADIDEDATVYFDYLIVNGETDRFSYVSVENWRMLGFSGNNIKNCITSS